MTAVHGENRRLRAVAAPDCSDGLNDLT